MFLSLNANKKFYSFLGSGVMLAVILLFINLALADSSGSLLPSSDGNYLQWTPKTGSTHYTMVDEASCNGTTDYNWTTTVGNRDSYGVSLTTIPNGATISQIDIRPCASRNNSGGATPKMNVFYRWNGSDSSDAGNYSLSGTTPVELATTTFSGLSLVKGSASTLELGAVLSSGTKGARLSRIATIVTYSPLNAPSNLDAVTVSQSQINLSWSDNSANENGFKIERSSVGAGGPWTQIASTTANVVSYNDTGLTPNTTYWYQVRAFNAGGDSGYSNVDFATTLQAKPAAPSNLIGMASGNDVILDWTDNSTNEDGFNVWRSSDGLNYASVATTTADATSYTDAGLGSGTWRHKVRAFNGGGYSLFSNVATTTIP